MWTCGASMRMRAVTAAAGGSGADGARAGAGDVCGAEQGGLAPAMRAVHMVQQEIGLMVVLFSVAIDIGGSGEGSYFGWLRASLARPSAQLFRIATLAVYLAAFMCLIACACGASH